MTSATPQAPGTAWGRVLLFFDTIKFEHSVFALPFAAATAFLVSDGLPDWEPLLWLAIAMVGARTFGMGANRVIDAEIDARNPRTATRAVPAGLISSRQVWVYMAVAMAAFLIAVSQLDRLAWFLSPVVIAMLIFYPYTKRFTWLAHLALGGVYIMIPPATWIAMTGDLNWGVTWLGVGAMFWVAGFDIIYATADIEIDRAQGLNSIPARFGIRSALWISRGFHLVTVVSLGIAGTLLDAHALYFIGTGAAAALLAFEQQLVSPNDLSKLGAAFFTMNGVIAVVFAGFVIAGTLVN
ncbi:MAG: putative 4-hydroxybenzoate polyprenyltransferase [Chloroflexi bacterium]|nr:putative 4-hydroxybenzoate polyprenyltransferase [Chloroflexota bacterium]